LTGDGDLFDMKQAPFKEIAVSKDTPDEDPKTGRLALQAALDSLKADAPPRPKKKKKKAGE